MHVKPGASCKDSGIPCRHPEFHRAGWPETETARFYCRRGDGTGTVPGRAYRHKPDRFRGRSKGRNKRRSKRRSKGRILMLDEDWNDDLAKTIALVLVMGLILGVVMELVLGPVIGVVME